MEGISLPNGIELVPVNVQEQYDFAVKNKITSVPTLMLENGNKLIGLKSPKEIINFVGENSI
jgi:hypothetical protein